MISPREEFGRSCFFMHSTAYVLKDREFWDSSFPSSSVGNANSLLSHSESSNPLKPIHATSSTASNRSITAGNPAVILPRYSTGHRPVLKEGMRAEPEAKLPKSRRGHKKSRQGCFECKKRKIKVGSSPDLIDNTEPSLVSRKSTGMYKLCTERTCVQISSY